MKRQVSDQKMKKSGGDGDNDKKKNKKGRLLVNINVVGSAGAIRFVVNEDDLVATVINTLLKTYSREGRLPLLGFDVNNFLLYCANETTGEALNPWEPIGARGARNFLLCKKQTQPHMTEGRSQMMVQKASGWKAWLNKSFTFKLLSH